MAYLLFHNFHVSYYHLMVQAAFRVEADFGAEVPPVVVEVCWFLSATRVFAHSFLCHFGMDGSGPFDLHKPLLGVFHSQLSLFDAPETQLLASSCLALQCNVSQLVVAF
jgi:hypothetical protein